MQRTFNKSILQGLLVVVPLVSGCSGDGGAPNVEISSSSTPSVADLAAPAADDWPWWRGPNRDGHARDAATVTTWGPSKNLLWQTEVPGRGHSSPIVVGKRVFLTSADDKAGKQLLLGFDRETGKSLWTTTAHEGSLARKHSKNTHASATPACDGERVFAVFLTGKGLFVTATDVDGLLLWQKEAGSFRSEHGYGSSPVLQGGLVIVNGESLRDGFLAALDRRTGEIVWRIARKTTGKHGSYGSPIVAKLAGKAQLITAGMGEVASYDPETGKLLWSCEGPSEVTGCTPAFGDDLVFVSGGFPEKNLLAIRPDGSGNVTASHVAWRTSKGVTYVPSPLYHDGHLYVVADDGQVTCLEAKTGKQVWQERLAGRFSASPTCAGDHLFVPNEEGEVFVLKAGPKFELIASNTLGSGGMATPTICDGRIFLRTDQRLFCVGQPRPASRPPVPPKS